MQNEAFADAARPSPRCILRLPMQTYSIGHEIILTQRRNPLVCLSHADFNALTTRQQIAALISAVLVCYSSWHEQDQSAKTGWFARWLENRQYKRWEKLIEDTDWPVAIMEFRIYRAEGSLCPVITDPKHSSLPADDNSVSRAFGSPFLARLIHFIAARTQNMMPPSLNPVMDYPFGQAAFEYFAAAEEQGRVQVENDDERETRESEEKHIRDIRAEHAERARAEADQSFIGESI